MRIRTGTAKDALLVPQPAVIEVQSQYMVVVLTPDNKAKFQPVKMGDRVGPNWIVTDGLKPGERVVVEGIQGADVCRCGGDSEGRRSGCR